MSFPDSQIYVAMRPSCFPLHPYSFPNISEDKGKNLGSLHIHDFPTCILGKVPAQIEEMVVSCHLGEICGKCSGLIADSTMPSGPSNVLQQIYPDFLQVDDKGKTRGII